jgi:hypothetical protein
MSGTLYLPLDVPFFVDPKTQAIELIWIKFLSEVQTGLSSVPWASIDFTGSSLADLATRSAAALNSGTLPLGRLSGITTTQLAAAAGVTLSQLESITDVRLVGRSAGSAGVPGQISVGSSLSLSGGVLNAAVTLAAGTYTPTLTGVANVAASTAYACQYLRVGATVTVSGKVDVDPTVGATLTQLGISLPIASALTAAEQCGGTGMSQDANYFGGIYADAANDRAQLNFTTVADVANRSWAFTFTYTLL